MKRPTLPQCVLVVSTVIASWLGMQAFHELGHVTGACLTGARVTGVFLDPLSFSRTDVAAGAQPLVEIWAGPALGSLLPCLVWAVAAAARLPGAYLARFFAGFCLVANGAYLGFGSFSGAGDAGDLLRHGAPVGSLWAFGLATVAPGLWLWHRQGVHFGLGQEGGVVSRRAAFTTLAAVLVWGAALLLIYRR